MTHKNLNNWLNRRDELILLFFALFVALMFAPALLGVL